MATLNLKNKTPLKAVLKPLSEKKEESKEAPESQATEVAEFIDCIMTGAVIVHKMHLRETGTGSYAAHKALNDLYNQLPEHADALAEAYQGYAGVILPNISEVNQMEYLAMNHLQYVEYLIKDVEEDRDCFGDCLALQSLVDALLVDLFSARYKLKFLE